MSEELSRYLKRVGLLLVVVALVALLTGNPVKRYFLIEDYSLPPKPPTPQTIDTTPQ